MSKIKVIVFDYDLTLYSVNEKYHNDFWVDYTAKLIEKLTEKMVQKNKEKFIEKYQLNKDRSVENFAKACNSEWGNCDALIQFMQTNYFEQDYENMRFIQPNIVENLAKKYRLYIISNAPSNNIIRQLRDVAGINPNLFEGIYTNPHNIMDDSKGFVLKQIMRAENVESQEILMLGDKMDVDILPAKKLGMNAELITDVDDILIKINAFES